MKWLFFLLCLSCVSANQVTKSGTPSYNYRADLIIQVGGATFDGVGVWKLDGPISIIFSSPVAMDRVSITSCAREDVFKDVKSPFTYAYNPSPTELAGSCALLIEIFSKEALTSWGYLAFRNDETLPAHAYFNAQGIQFAGFSVGQSKNGLEQTISFKEPVNFVAEPGCHVTTTDKTNFTFVPSLGFCRASFKSKSGLYHRMTFLAYDSVLIRE